MPVPDFQTVMLPLVRYARDGQEHVLAKAIEALADEFKLTAQERRQLLPSGAQATFNNRVYWAAFHLRKARVFESKGHGRFYISERGRELLDRQPVRIEMSTLMEYPEYREFRAGSGKQATPSGRDEGVETAAPASERPPMEVLEDAYQQMRRLLEQEVLERVKADSPRFFEDLVLRLLVAMGYGGSMANASRVGRSGDGGIDGIIQEDRLGLDAIYVQAKRWEGTVPISEVRAFSGSLDAHRARRGVLITTSQFPRDAERYVASIEKRIVLIDGQRLAQLMVDHGIGVTDVATYTVRRIDPGFFEGEGG